MLRITTLSENTSGMGDFLAEWGLSILVETATTRILMDAGTSISTIHNADSLGIDLARIDLIVLSHGHHDHTGGLRELLRRMRKEWTYSLIRMSGKLNITAERTIRKDSLGFLSGGKNWKVWVRILD